MKKYLFIFFVIFSIFGSSMVLSLYFYRASLSSPQSPLEKRRNGSQGSQHLGALLLQEKDPSSHRIDADIFLKKKPDGTITAIIRAEGEEILKLEGIFKELNGEEKSFVEKVRKYLLENGAIRDIIELKIPVYLPTSDVIFLELGAANTIGFGKNTFILLREDFFKEKDIDKVSQLNLRTFYHEYCHGYLAITYGEKIRIDEDEAFAWYMENLIAAFWEYRKQAFLEPKNQRRYKEIYDYKLKKLLENYPLAKKYWKSHWKLPDL